MKLLLTEDDEQLGGALQAILASHGYVVTWVRSAEDAQRFIDSEHFDLMLIDIVLPRMSGLDLLRWTEAEYGADSNAVDVHIYSLRKKLGNDLIGTVRGVGYVLEDA
jgi:DNA-binding response OmpR family regulator